MSMERDLEFIYEIGTLRFLQRTWTQLLRNRDMANLAEHSFRVAWTAMTIAKYEDADVGKVAKMALVHDISESRTGDAHYVSRLYVKRDEARAIRDLLTDTVLGEELVALWNEYEERQTLEAKCVKDADWLDVDIELQEMYAKGEKIAEAHVWHDSREKGVYPKLHTETGKRLWKAFYESNPHDWHLHAPNRFNQGDWKNKEELSHTPSQL